MTFRSPSGTLHSSRTSWAVEVAAQHPSPVKTFSRLAVLGLVVAWFLLLRPVALGGPAGYEIVSGSSMEPILHTGDLVITQSASTYAVGDLIAFHVPAGQPGAGSIVIHRIVGGDGASGFIVKGDNKPAADSWQPRASDLIGRSWIELPGSGKVLLLLRQPLVLAALLGGLAGVWFFTSESGTSSTTKRGLAGGPTGWIRRRSRRLSEAAEWSGHPVASLTPSRTCASETPGSWRGDEGTDGRFSETDAGRGDSDPADGAVGHVGGLSEAHRGHTPGLHVRRVRPFRHLPISPSRPQRPAPT